MAQRSTRRFLNLVSLAAHQKAFSLIRKRAGGIHRGQGTHFPVEGRIHLRRPNRHLKFPLANPRRTIHSDIR